MPIGPMTPFPGPERMPIARRSHNGLPLKTDCRDEQLTLPRSYSQTQYVQIAICRDATHYRFLIRGRILQDGLQMRQLNA